jgi:hypothetical protein
VIEPSSDSVGSLWYRLIFKVGDLDYEWAESVAAAIAR